MAKLVFAMNVSIDGYVDFTDSVPSPVLFRHWTTHTQGLAGSLYGRVIYEMMRVWETDYWDQKSDPRQAADLAEFAAAWRKHPKWVVSRSQPPVGPNATLIDGDHLEAAVREIKERVHGEIAVAGPSLAQSLSEYGLIDEYRLYLHPVVLGRGKPFFAGPRPPLRLVGSDNIDGSVVRLTYAPA